MTEFGLNLSAQGKVFKEYLAGGEGNPFKKMTGGTPEVRSDKS